MSAVNANVGRCDSSIIDLQSISLQTKAGQYLEDIPVTLGFIKGHRRCNTKPKTLPHR
jgi:hypothetical protein